MLWNLRASGEGKAGSEIEEATREDFWREFVDWARGIYR